VSRLLRDGSICQKLRGTDNADALYALLTDHTESHALRPEQVLVIGLMRARPSPPTPPSQRERSSRLPGRRICDAPAAGPSLSRPAGRGLG